VDDVSLAIRPGECLGLVGESGSGKSTLGRVALGLQPCESGTVRFAGADLSRLAYRDLQRLRSQMTIVFQEPLESLNPRMTVGAIVDEPLQIHAPELSGKERKRRVLETLALVALPDTFYDRYPRRLSGGQAQRVSIARAIITRPRFVVFDEPTSALDLSVQAQILELIQRLRAELDLAYLFISHDLDCVGYLADRVAVMYRGQIIELGPAEPVLQQPKHPYTQALLSSSLSLHPTPDVAPRTVLLAEYGGGATGCVYFPRCPYRSDRRCETQRPELREVAPEHWVASFYNVGEN
jgi:oligopeptide/dipeptide ABC transporter ATP-binding protein